MVALFKKVDAGCFGTMLKIMRRDFEEASRLIGTHLLRRMVSEALARITPLRQDEVEELLESGRLKEVLSRRSSGLLERGLDIEQAYLGMLEACRISGKGSISSKVKGLAVLLSKASDEEAVLIANILTGRQKPVDDGLILKALEEAFRGSVSMGTGTTCGGGHPKDVYRIAMRVVEDVG